MNCVEHNSPKTIEVGDRVGIIAGHHRGEIGFVREIIVDAVLVESEAHGDRNWIDIRHVRVLP